MLLLYVFLVFRHEASGILVPQLVIEPTHPAVESRVLTTGLPEKSLLCFILNNELRLIFFPLFEPAFMREANRLLIEFSSVQSLSRVRLFATLGTAACRASITNCQSLLKLVSIELVKSIWDTSNTILTIPMTILPFLKYIFSNYLVKS